MAHASPRLHCRAWHLPMRRPRCSAASARATSPVMPDAPARASFAPFSVSPKLDIMQWKPGNRLQPLRNGQPFLEDIAAVLDAVLQTGAHRHLDDAITPLATRASDQGVGHIASHGSLRQQGALCTVLVRDHMSPPIARIARADRLETPAIALRIPPRVPARSASPPPQTIQPTRHEWQRHLQLCGPPWYARQLRDTTLAW
ncbi:hypothetical protein BH09GEM1_BH09GEM1_01850 [soil metagenome]